MHDLYHKLALLGYSKDYLFANYALPDWWCAEMEQEPQAEVYAALYISRKLGISVKKLLDLDE